MIGVALDHGEPLGHAEVDAGLAQLNAAPIDMLFFLQELQKLACPAANIQHPRAGFDHASDQQQVDTRLRDLSGRVRRTVFKSRHRHVRSLSLGVEGNPRFCFAASRKPRTVSNNSGSCKRKASWPLSLSISTKLTFAATAFSA